MVPNSIWRRSPRISRPRARNRSTASTCAHSSISVSGRVAQGIDGCRRLPNSRNRTPVLGRAVKSSRELGPKLRSPFQPSQQVVSLRWTVRGGAHVGCGPCTRNRCVADWSRKAKCLYFFLSIQSAALRPVCDGSRRDRSANDVRRRHPRADTHFVAGFLSGLNEGARCEAKTGGQVTGSRYRSARTLCCINGRMRAVISPVEGRHGAPEVLLV